MRRSMLFLPANSPNMVVNGGVLGADSLIFDLEDAVSPDEKDAARELVKNALTALDFGKCERIVRINGLDTPYWEEDLRAILPLRPDAIMPPKAIFCIKLQTCEIQNQFSSDQRLQFPSKRILKKLISKSSVNLHIYIIHIFCLRNEASSISTNLSDCPETTLRTNILSDLVNSS